MPGIMEAIDADLIDPTRLAECVIDRLKSERRKKPPERLHMTAREALKAAHFECLLVSVAAQNLAHGLALNQVDLDRLLVAYLRLDAIAAEALQWPSQP